jgi:hypothetical protein
VTHCTRTIAPPLSPCACTSCTRTSEQFCVSLQCHTTCPVCCPRTVANVAVLRSTPCTHTTELSSECPRSQCSRSLAWPHAQRPCCSRMQQSCTLSSLLFTMAVVVLRLYSSNGFPTNLRNRTRCYNPISHRRVGLEVRGGEGLMTRVGNMSSGTCMREEETNITRRPELDDQIVCHVFIRDIRDHM